MSHMEKNLLNDIEMPAHKRSIRDIPIPETRKVVTDNTVSSDDSHAINLKKVRLEKTNKNIPATNPYNTTHHQEEPFFKEAHIKSGSGFSFKVPIILSVILLLVIFVFNFFHNADITVYPKNASAQVNTELAVVNSEDKKTEVELVYKTLEFTGDAKEDITASGEEYISEKASGVITIYNKYTTKSQSLIKNTRFEAPNGKIYRINETVSVPGYKTVSGEIKPGTLDVTVYADEPGDGYQNGLVDFTIPGFKGQPQYDTFYARGKTNITGGYVGTRKVVSEEQLKSAQAAVTEKLKAMLRQNLTDQLPSNLVVINSDDSAFVFEDFTREDKTDNVVTIKLKGFLPVKVVDKNKLSQKIAESSIGGSYVIGSPILVTNLSEMTMKLNENNTLSIIGNAKFVWQLDPKEMKQKIVGKKRNEAINMFSEFTGIDRVEVKISPLWKNSFPENTDRISVIQVLPN